MEAELWTWDYPRDASAVRVLMDLANELGLAPERCFAGSGITKDDLLDPEYVVQAAQELTVIRNIVVFAQDRPGLGVAAGSRVTLGMLGIFGFAMLLRPTVEDFLRLAIRHRRLSPIFLRPNLVRRGQTARLELDEEGLPAEVRDFILERDLAGTGTIIPTLAGEPLPMRLETTLSPERREVLAAAVPHAEVVAGERLNAFVFDQEVFLHRLPTADPRSMDLYEDRCADAETFRAQRIGLSGRVRSALLRNRGPMPTLDEIAAERHVDPRTLRRHLAAEGVSFRDLRNEARRTLAIQLLEEGKCSVTQIALQLGYSDTGAFSRAFKQWTGISPREYASTRKASARKSG